MIISNKSCIAEFNKLNIPDTLIEIPSSKIDNEMLCS